MTKNMYIIRGGPASGKTTLTLLLAKYLPQPTALLEQDNWRWGIHLAGRKISDVQPHEHTFADQVFMKTIKLYLAEQRYTMIIEGSFGWHSSETTDLSASTMKKLAEKNGYTFTSIVLEAGKGTQQKRNLSRKYTVPQKEFSKIYETVYSHYDQSEIIINSTNQTQEATLETILEALHIKS